VFQVLVFLELVEVLFDLGLQDVHVVLVAHSVLLFFRFFYVALLVVVAPPYVPWR